VLRFNQEVEILSAHEQTLVDSQLLHKLERLTVRWHKSFPGLVGGHNLSHFPGPGIEFLDHRHFHHGDDLRAVNWRAYMRLEKLFLKMFQVEPRVPVRMLIDVSPSMQTGSPSKFLYAKKLAAAMSYVGLVRLDTICLQPFADHLYDSFLCGGGRHRFMPAVEYLTQLPAGVPTNFLQVARQFVANYPQRGLLIIISDFLDDGDCVKPLQYLADFGHELLLMQLWAEEDRTPPWDGELDLEDAETGSRVTLSFDEVAREQYTSGFDEYSERLERVALRNTGRYCGFSTALPLEEAIFGPVVHTRTLQ
jgi:uncharacterized protein (DUF58 family)